MNYPNGKPFKGNTTMVGRNGKSNSSNIEYGGRGMTLEKDIELSNDYYLKHGKAVIHKSQHLFKSLMFIIPSEVKSYK